MSWCGQATPSRGSFPSAWPGPIQASVTVSFPLDGAAVSLTFDAERFIAFVEQLRRFAETMPGRPS